MLTKCYFVGCHEKYWSVREETIEYIKWVYYSYYYCEEKNMCKPLTIMRIDGALIHKMLGCKTTRVGCVPATFPKF
jgi:hypothetical protein